MPSPDTRSGSEKENYFILTVPESVGFCCDHFPPMERGKREHQYFRSLLLTFVEVPAREKERNGGTKNEQEEEKRPSECGALPIRLHQSWAHSVIFESLRSVKRELCAVS